MMLDAETRSWLLEQGRIWSRTEREKHRQHTEPLPADVRETVEPFFEPAILEQARYRAVPSIEHPPFRVEALSRGMPDKLDYTQVMGLTHGHEAVPRRA